MKGEGGDRESKGRLADAGGDEYFPGDSSARGQAKSEFPKDRCFL